MFVRDRHRARTTQVVQPVVAVPTSTQASALHESRRGAWIEVGPERDDENGAVKRARVGLDAFGDRINRTYDGLYKSNARLDQVTIPMT